MVIVKPIQIVKCKCRLYLQNVSVNSAKSVTNIFVITIRGFQPATICVRGVRDHDTTRAIARHIWEIRSLNWAQFMLQWFIRFREFSEFLFYLSDSLKSMNLMKALLHFNKYFSYFSKESWWVVLQGISSCWNYWEYSILSGKQYISIEHILIVISYSANPVVKKFENKC